MTDRLYSTSQAGQLLGGINPDDVRRLIRDGKLNAVPMIVRGKGKRPRKYIPASDLQKFIQDLRGVLVSKLERIDRRVSRAKEKPEAVTQYYR